MTKQFKDYWWVNQNKTFESEIKGYMWSPKRQKNNARLEFYENMTRVKVGDAVFSYAGSHIKAIGVVESTAVTRSRPKEFGDQWDKDGWFVKVNWLRLKNPFRPKHYIDELRSFLPKKYSPLKDSGDGKELYLAHTGTALGSQLLRITIDNNPELETELRNL
jgi:hypothetical protein